MCRTSRHCIYPRALPAVLPDRPRPQSRSLLRRRTGAGRRGAQICEVDLTSASDGGDANGNKLKRALSGVNVLIDVLGGGTTDRRRKALFHAAFEASVVVYFPSNYGVQVSPISHFAPFGRSNDKANSLVAVYTTCTFDQYQASLMP
jgi:hypothetical protein